MNRPDPPDLLDQLAVNAPMRRMSARFERLLADPPGARRWSPARMAAAAAVILAGLLLAVRLLGPGAVPDGRAAAALDLLEAPTSFERLRGINAAAALPALEPPLRSALLRRLETDPSVSVRLAAIDALLVATSEPLKRERLVQALISQDTAIVQAHLGHQLRRRRLLTGAELDRVVEMPGVHADARNALIAKENL